MREDEFFGRRRQREELLDALDRRQAVQILGERRTGKSSLLRWVERHAPPGLPVVWINAQGLDGRSPVDLVLAVARGLGRLAEAEDRIRSYGTLPPARAAERVLGLLVPVALLVDEAEALTKSEHGFDQDFFNALRSFGQEADERRRMVWISASRSDLLSLFAQSGLASTFLNDARLSTVGALEPDAAREVLARGVSEARLVERVIEQTGANAFGLQWLGEALWRAPDDVERAFDAFVAWFETVLSAWWHALDDRDRAILKRAVVRPISVDTAGEDERRHARGLVERGLLREEDKQFAPLGTAWRRFVDGR